MLDRLNPPSRRPPGPHSRFPAEVTLRCALTSWGISRTCAGSTATQFSFARRRDFYVFNHPDAIRDVLVTRDDCFIKGPALQRAKDTLGEGLLTSEGDFHKRQRRLAQPAFHPNQVATYAKAMVDLASRAAQGWRDGQRMNLHEEMMKVTLRIVAKTLFDAEVESDLEAIGKAMDISVGMFTRTMTPWGPLLNKLPLPSNFRFKRAAQSCSVRLTALFASIEKTGIGATCFQS